MDASSRAMDLVNEFKEFSDWEDRYRYIINLGKELALMPEDFKTDANKVKGCQSQVWLHASLNGDKIEFLSDSDASIVKGIVAILLRVYSNSTPDEILSLKPNFIDEIGLRQHLSMSRANGLNSLLKQISLYALAFKTKLNMTKT